MDVISVENTSLKCPTSKHIREFTLERNPMGVISVDNTSLKCQALKHIREFILERNLMDVISVDNTSLTSPVVTNTREFILERNHISVEIVLLLQAAKNVMGVHICKMHLISVNSMTIISIEMMRKSI